MSLDIRYVTNGTKTFYRVIDSAAETFNIYNTRDEIPSSIRHYAPKGEPKFVGPDLARIFGVCDILYPNFLLLFPKEIFHLQIHLELHYILLIEFYYHYLLYMLQLVC